MNRLPRQIEYQEKVAELAKMVNDEAIKLQNVIQSKDKAILETRQLGEKKAVIVNQLREIKEEIREGEKSLQGTIDRKRNIVGSVKQDLTKEKVYLEGNIKDKKKHLSDLTKEEYKEELKKQKHFKEHSLEGLQEKVINKKEELKETESRIERNKDLIKERELVVKDYKSHLIKIDNLKRKAEEIKREQKTEKQQLDTKHKELDTKRKEMDDLHGKMGSYVQTMKDTVKFSNDYFDKHGVNIKFMEPVDINFDNFYIKPKDS